MEKEIIRIEEDSINKTRVTYLVQWLEILSNGHVKPYRQEERSECCVNQSSVRDSNKFIELINGINASLQIELGVPTLSESELKILMQRNKSIKLGI